MTRFTDGPHGLVREFEKRLDAAGLTVEIAQAMLEDDSRLRAWVAKADENVEPEPPRIRVPIEAAFGGKGALMHKLLRMEFLYLDEVVELAEREFLNIRGIGQTSVRKIKGVLSQHGLKFSETYSVPSLLVYDDWGWTCFYRPRVMTVKLTWLVKLDYNDWLDRSRWDDDLTLGAFIAMSDEQQLQALSETGITKVRALVARL